MGKKVEIYHLIEHEDNYQKMFRSYEFVTQYYGPINVKDYKKVYACQRAGFAATLDGIYEEFNIHHPGDYKAHSVSVGDVIVLTDSRGTRAHYVNDIGFVDITNEFFKEVIC